MKKNIINCYSDFRKNANAALNAADVIYVESKKTTARYDAC